MLDRLPAGTSLFIDANIFLYHLLDVRPSCTRLFARIRAREVRGYTSVPVLSEVLHQLMLAEVGSRDPAMTPGGALRQLRRHPHMIAGLEQFPILLPQLGAWRVRILPARWPDLKLAADLARRHHLLTTDALILASMRSHDLTHLASNDSDFAHVPGITVWRP